MSKKNFRTHQITLSAGADLSLNVAGNMYAVIDSTGEFSITFDESQKIEKADKGTGGEFQESYGRVTLNSPTAQTVTVVFGFGRYRDSRASLNATVNTVIEGSNTVNNPGDKTVGISATLLIAANANRKSVQFFVPSTADHGVRLGNATVTTASGILIEPGSTREYFDESAWYAIREAGATSDVEVQVLEMERP